MHNWAVTTNNRTHCQGHCQATAVRDTKTGLLLTFDLYGQNRHGKAESEDGTVNSSSALTDQPGESH